MTRRKSRSRSRSPNNQKSLKDFVTGHKDKYNRGLQDTSKVMNNRDLSNILTPFIHGSRQMYNKQIEKESRSNYMFVVSWFRTTSERTFPNLHTTLFNTFEKASNKFLAIVRAHADRMLFNELSLRDLNNAQIKTFVKNMTLDQLYELCDHNPDPANNNNFISFVKKDNGIEVCTRTLDGGFDFEQYIFKLQRVEINNPGIIWRGMFDTEWYV